MQFELSDKHWSKVEPFLRSRAGPKGGRPWADDRACFEGILWVLRSGARWKDLPKEFPSPATCWRRLHRWERESAWRTAWQAYLGELDAKGLIDWNEAFIDASFAPAKRGVSRLGKPAKERARSGWWWQTVRDYQLVSTLRARVLAKSLSPSERSRLYESLARIKADPGRSRSD